MTKILFCSYGGGHVTAIIPVFKAMEKRGYSCQYLALTTAGDIAARAGIKHTRPIDYININDPVIQKWGRKLAAIHHTDGKGISIDESIAYLGTLFRDLAIDIGESDAWEQYKKHGLNAFCPVYFMHKVLQQEKPDVVVATTSPRMEKAILRAAFQLNIPSLCMIELFGIQEESWLSRPDNGDFLAVSRTEVINRLTACGRKRADFFLTGSPMFDQLANPKLKQKGCEWRKEREVDENQTLIFWAEQPEPLEPELPRRVRNHLAEICRKNGWKLVVRLHPSSTDENKERIPDDCIQSYSYEDLPSVIHACDVTVTLTSTVGWEALLSLKPLLVIKISHYQDMVSYGKDDGALTVSTLKDAEQGLVTLLTTNEVSEKLAKLRENLPKPGKATQNICELLETQIIRKKR